jgi:hypothetical protein
MNRGAQMKHKPFYIFLLSAVLTSSFATSCVTRGKDFLSRFDWIQEGKTRQMDVKSALGDPQSIGLNSGLPQWTYGFYKHSLFKESQTKELRFWWNPDKTVKSWSFTSSFQDDTQEVVGPTPRPSSDVAR